MFAGSRLLLPVPTNFITIYKHTFSIAAVQVKNIDVN